MSVFYPDFLRRIVTPSRHEAAAEEVDKELLDGSALTFSDGTSETPGISAEIREFLKLRAEKRIRRKAGRV